MVSNLAVFIFLAVLRTTHLHLWLACIHKGSVRTYVRLKWYARKAFVFPGMAGMPEIMTCTARNNLKNITLLLVIYQPEVLNPQCFVPLHCYWKIKLIWSCVDAFCLLNTELVYLSVLVSIMPAHQKTFNVDSIRVSKISVSLVLHWN